MMVSARRTFLTDTIMQDLPNRHHLGRSCVMVSVRKVLHGGTC